MPGVARPGSVGEAARYKGAHGKVVSGTAPLPLSHVTGPSATGTTYMETDGAAADSQAAQDTGTLDSASPAETQGGGRGEPPRHTEVFRLAVSPAGGRATVTSIHSGTGTWQAGGGSGRMGMGRDSGRVVGTGWFGRASKRGQG